MTADLQSLPPPEKRIAAKVLYDMGWSSRKIEEWIGMDNVTVIRSSEEQTPDSMKQFETDFRLAITAEKQRGVALGIKRLNEIIPKERRVSELVKGLEYLEGKTQTTNIQLNNLIKIE